MSKEQSGVIKAWEATIRKTQAAKKRANNLFGSISVAHVDEKNYDDQDSNDTISYESTESTSEPYHVEKILPNGDYYIGQWYNNFPNGQGKYIWTDGCMYVGDWYRGKTMGVGRFTWPFGATYEGDFKNGFMDGNGTYVNSKGETYKGQWMMNMKHGKGTVKYLNGDSYEGEWRRGFQDGHGRYQWKNGNAYNGEWRNHTMFGKGTFIWENGNRYDGFWEDNVPKGNGTLKWPDGSFYVGNWSKDQNEMHGAFYPVGSSLDEEGNTKTLEWDPHDVYKVDLADCHVSIIEKVEILPSQKKLAVWNSSKVGRDLHPRGASLDGRISVGLEKPSDKMKIWEGEDDAYLNFHGNKELYSEASLKVPKVVKSQGETICKGHKNYELMLNLQLGIRHSVGRPGPAPSLDLKASAFDPKEKIWTKFPPEGSKYTPPHQSCEFKWKDYCPLVFRTLRKLFNVDPADYMISICGDDALRELSSPGKSGSFFYLTKDDRYMIKTMKKSEAKVLIRMLSAYYNHVRAFEDTLVTKFFGLHCVKLSGPTQKKVRFIIMGNLFCSEYAIHRKYDLKGSSLGRTTDKAMTEIDANTILKDLDLNFLFCLQKAWFLEFSRQIDRDCEFLEQERIMDYSLLVGLHFRETTENGNLIPSSIKPPMGENEGDGCPRLSRADMDQLLLDPTRWDRIKLGINMPARVERTVRQNDGETQLVGEPTGEYYDVIMYFGIIDILQDYDISKKLEHAYKSIQYDPNSISAVDPKLYSRRFRNFIFKIFCEDA